MMSTLELDERKQKILHAIIRDYLETAEPVPSQHIFQKYQLGISPATIRNEMILLEEGGFIKQPYTSAGRIPTDKGYRFYVDKLMKIHHLTERELRFIEDRYRRSRSDIEDVLHQTLDIVASLLHYVSVIVTPKFRGKNEVYSAGISNLFEQPEFKDMEHLRHFIKFMEEQEFLASMLKEYSKPKKVNIKIGHENKYKEIYECSVIATSYSGGGSLGIIGPTRMFYNKAISLMEYISSELSKAFGEEI